MINEREPRFAVIDTAGQSVAIELCHGNYIAAAVAMDAGHHVRALTAQLRRLLAEAGWELAEIAAIGLNIGPGSFTGIRVGLATAKAIAYVGRQKLVGVDMFDACGRSVVKARKTPRLDVLMEGQLRTVTAVRFATHDGIVTRAPPRVIPYDRLAIALEADVPVICGSAALGKVLPAGITAVEAVPALRATVLERIRLAMYDNPMALEPYYARPSSAEEKWDARSNP